MSSQWLFPLSAFHATPSSCSLDKELYDRARGIEFLFRLGSSLALPTSAMLTAATWFHRFYMRYALEEFHRQDVAASCIFLATKTEECGRKLKDVARIAHSKASGKDLNSIPVECKEVEQCQANILLTEEALLEALCFDFVVKSPHIELLDLFECHKPHFLIQEFSWSLAHDSYRTPVCILYPSNVIAAACFILAQRLFDGPNSPSLDARISASAPSASLPTPPSHNPPSPDASRTAVERYSFSSEESVSVSEVLSILLEFYQVQDHQNVYPYLHTIVAVPPPTVTGKPGLYLLQTQHSVVSSNQQILEGPNETTPKSTRGSNTPTSTLNAGAHLNPK